MATTTVRAWATASLAASLVWAASVRAADDPKTPPARPPAQVPAGTFDPEVTRALNESWPDHPEWVDMLTDILNDAPMGPQYGWFRTAATQTRFDWESTRKRLDRDGDGKVTREEFRGPAADFRRLDHDLDGSVTAADFDFSKAPPYPPIGAMLFSRADRDGDGKVTREELDALFNRADSTGQGFLSQTDLIEAFTMPSGPPGSAGMPSKATLVRGLFKQELGSLQPGPKLDETAPDFTLRTNDGEREVTLSKLVGPKPVVLIFGNFTCGPFRVQTGNIEKLHHRYKDRATFVMVYVREAHPTDGWRMESNDRVGVAIPQPRTYEERVGVAQACGKALKLSFPMLVDTIDDRVGGQYSGMPGRFYLIDKAGKVAFKNGRGPYGFKPAELEHALVLLLQQESSEAPVAASSRP
jgi:hypothetical protein